MNDIILLARAYRAFLLELGEEFKELKGTKGYEGFADSFIDMVKSPEIGFTVTEAENLMLMYNKFCLLDSNDLPSHHAMKLMVKLPTVDMEVLEQAKTLSVTDFKESLKDKEIGTQERTYKYEIIKRTVETGSIHRVYGEELEEVIKSLQI